MGASPRHWNRDTEIGELHPNIAKLTADQGIFRGYGAYLVGRKKRSTANGNGRMEVRPLRMVFRHPFMMGEPAICGHFATQCPLGTAPQQSS